jgi:hypothetical protein
VPELLEGVIAAEKVTLEKRVPKHKRTIEQSTNAISELSDTSMDEFECEQRQNHDL